MGRMVHDQGHHYIDVLTGTMKAQAVTYRDGSGREEFGGKLGEGIEEGRRDIRMSNC